jgi:KDO2-lipid IV(A) lauroyltransferase
MIQTRATPADLARWAFWGPLRRALDPKSPGRIQALRGAWPLQWLAAGSRREVMADEYRRCFGARYTEEGYTQLVRDAYRQAWRTHLEELLLSRLGPDNIDQWLRFSGQAHLDQALSMGKGVVWVYPHAGPVMLMIAGLAHRGYAYTQYAARGLPPEDVARDHPELLASNRLRAAVRREREANEDAVPARYITLDTPVRELLRRLEANEVVGLAFDGRIGQGWWPAPYLGRTALLSPGPYKLAVASGAPVVPVFCHSPMSGPAICEIGPAVEPGKDWKHLAGEVLQQQESWLTRFPEEYGIWLLHARERNRIDDHPLFIDHAEDDRWRRWAPDGVSALSAEG